MISMTDVDLTFPDGEGVATALDGIGLTVADGESVAIVGPSGCGKSSLLAVAATLQHPDRGEVRIGRTEVTALDRGEAAAFRRTSIGIVFQQANLLPALTAEEQLLAMTMLGGRRSRVSRAASDRARELLDAVGLADRATKHPHQLSGGQRQRVGIARALMHDPDVLLVDEPTSALDQANGARIVELLLALTDGRRASMLFVTHDRTHLGAFDRIVSMRDGRLDAADARV